MITARSIRIAIILALAVTAAGCQRSRHDDSAAADAIAPQDVAPPVPADNVSDLPITAAPVAAVPEAPPPPAAAPAPAPKVTQSQQIQDDADAVGMTARTDSPPAQGEPAQKDAQ